MVFGGSIKHTIGRPRNRVNTRSFALGQHRYDLLEHECIQNVCESSVLGVTDMYVEVAGHDSHKQHNELGEDLVSN